MRAFRDSLRMTREEFGAKYGISPSTLSGYERDQRAPHAEGLVVFANAGANVNWLLTGDGPISAYQVNGPTTLLAVNEPQPVNIDSVLLQQVTDFFFAWMRSNGVRIDQAKYGAVIALLYRISATSGKVRNEELEQVLALAA